MTVEKEDMLDDVSVKKVDLDNIDLPRHEENKIGIRVISYAEEEAFLESLKQLQKNLL